MEEKKQIDVILVSLGTPSELSSKAIRTFLRRFLSDRRVVEAPRLLWLPILYAIILPFRPPKLKHAYAEIWQRQGGSPLKVISDKQKLALEHALQQDQSCADCDIAVHSVMLYSDENVKEFLTKRAPLKRKTIVLPLYPQYSATTTAAVYDQVFEAYRQLRYIPEHFVINSYFSHRLYRQALKQSVDDFWQCNSAAEHLLVSFHGIPQECVDRGDPYYQQCVATANNLQQDLQLSDEQLSFSFQSRLGPKQWLQPYTDEKIKLLAQQGYKNIDVICPSFSSDCLETLEEIAIQGRETFVEAGGENLRLIPCLNEQSMHINLFKQLILENI